MNPHQAGASATLDQHDTRRLAALLHPLDAACFMNQKWPSCFHHFSGPPERLGELIGHPDFADPAALVRSPVLGQLLAEGTREHRRVEADIDAQRALALYEQGNTLFVNRLGNEPALAWAATLDRAFGLIPGTTQVNAFASLPGPGIGWHWDPQEIFIVQVRGRKRWNVAPNEDADWPTTSGSPGAEKKVPQLRHQLNDPARPIRAPRHWSSIEMMPGSVLFLPRGYWHQTENIDASMHLVLQVKLLSWRDVFKYLLDKVPLFHGEQWRGPALGLHPDHLHEDGLAQFRTRCADFERFASPQGVAALAQLFSSSRSQAPQASVQQALKLSQPSWRDVFKRLLEEAPELYSPAWRKPTTALTPGQLAGPGLAEFAQRCAELRAFAASGAAALGAVPAPPTN